MKLLVIILILLPLNLFAAGQIMQIMDPQEVLADIYDASKMEKGSKVIILSRKAGKAIAFGSILKIDMTISPHEALISIEEIIGNQMIMVKDLVYPVDYQIMKDKNIPGFSSLSLQGDNDIPARFKELAYFGVFTSEGHTLDAQEFLVSPFQLQYGMTNDLGVKMVSALWLDGYANLGLKYRAIRNKHVKITMNTLGAYKVQSNDYIWQVGGVISLPQNAKFINHSMVNITLDPQFSNAHATKDLGLFTNSDIRNITEYITDDWNRIIYGPTYNVELQTLGGTASYMWLWSTFHMSLGMATQDFTNLNFSTNGYYYVYDFFWRF